MSGNAIFRVGSQDYLTFQLKSNGIAVDLTLAQNIEFHAWIDENVICWKKNDDPQKLFLIPSFEGVIDDGIVQLRPDGDELEEDKLYSYIFIVVDSIGRHPFPLGMDLPTEYSLETLPDSICPS